MREFRLAQGMCGHTVAWIRILCPTHGAFPKLGVPTIRIIVYWGLYWGLLILGNYHMTVAGWEEYPNLSFDDASGSGARTSGGLGGT